ncbi:MAG TPA: SDR family NAD(P)-dependent oxidoreductase [Solirubrobacteraceae bacterium]|nr:SDR family NAD(P)-dependent oxidoreductase [Solirubrobacteraceae bacterium]
METSNLRGSTVLVTGAGSGIGRELALLAARRGADLVICDVDEPGLAEVETAVRDRGGRVLARRVDVASRDQMRDFAEAVQAEAGPVDLLVNNAGVGLGAGFLDTELEDWDWVLAVNLLGVVHGCHFFVPRMVERGAGGHVVNLSSMAGFFASPSLAAYSTSKFAVLGLSEALREELRPHGIGVTAICPGMINTPITRNAPARGLLADPAARERVVSLYRRRNYGADRVARNILRAVDRDRTVSPVAAEAWIAYAIKRISPRLAGWAARRLAAATD